MLGAVVVIVARATIPRQLVFPDFALRDVGNGFKHSPFTSIPFWIALVCQIVIVVGYFWYYRKERFLAYSSFFDQYYCRLGIAAARPRPFSHQVQLSSPKFVPTSTIPSGEACASNSPAILEIPLHLRLHRTPCKRRTRPCSKGLATCHFCLHQSRSAAHAHGQSTFCNLSCVQRRHLRVGRHLRVRHRFIPRQDHWTAL